MYKKLIFDVIMANIYNTIIFLNVQSVSSFCRTFPLFSFLFLKFSVNSAGSFLTNPWYLVSSFSRVAMVFSLNLTSGSLSSGTLIAMYSCCGNSRSRGSSTLKDYWLYTKHGFRQYNFKPSLQIKCEKTNVLLPLKQTNTTFLRPSLFINKKNILLKIWMVSLLI